MRVRWLPLMANSFAVSGMVIAEPGVGATTRLAAHMGSSSMGLRFLRITRKGGGGTGERGGKGGRVRGPKGGNDERVDELNGQGNDQGLGAKGVNGNIQGVNGCVGGAPDFSIIIAQQLQNILPSMLAHVGNQGNVGNQNRNVVNENVQENVGNVLVNDNRVGCSYKEFLACNPKEYDGKGGVVVLTRWIEKMKSVQDMSGCSIGSEALLTRALNESTS
ncbi:hypothetical protein Tco_1117736 [Tanacetum coccineum]